MYAYRKTVLRIAAGAIDSCGKIFFWKKETASRSFSRILIIKLDHLGDCFLMTPLFSYLKKRFPNAVIDLVCLESSAGIFEGNSCIHEIITFNKKRVVRKPDTPASKRDFWTLVSKLRKNNYDLFIDPRGDFTAAILGFLSGAPYRIGFEKEEAGGFLYTQRLRYNRSAHETDKYTVLLNALKIDITGWSPAIHPSEDENYKTKEIISGVHKPFAVIHPGAGLAYKMWPLEKWMAVTEYLNKKGYDIVFTGGVADLALAEKIILANAQKQGVHICAGSLSIRETYFLISQSSLFLGNDSVPGHFAGSLGIASVVLMNSSVNSRRWRPLGEKVYVLSGKDTNHFCLLDGCQYPCPHMENISVEKVIETLDSMGK
jgi:ADP-heptose:LPS heptosyltransferase